MPTVHILNNSANSQRTRTVKNASYFAKIQSQSHFYFVATLLRCISNVQKSDVLQGNTLHTCKVIEKKLLVY